MYQVIARKYRPQSFAELIGQEPVRTTLENALAQNRIAHGYIFSGQRGTGKTTVARILARCLNCLKGPTISPCGVCPNCNEISSGNAVDVIEIDAASNRGINEMRELRENVRYRPARDRYKVFIVDEAHQITSEAFNALLKTLEEPPEWVVFILCTTEAHKIPTTIASRCQQFSFRSIDFAELVSRMEWILKQEGIEADQEVLAVLAQAGEGSVRDSLSALDQAIACCGTTLKAREVRGLLGLSSLESLELVTQALVDSNSERMLEIVQELERNGQSLQHFCRELARYFRNLLVAKVAAKNTRLIAASAREQERLCEIAGRFSEEDLTRYLQLTLELFKDMQTSLQQRLHLEIGLLRLVQLGNLMPIEQALASLGTGGGGQGMPQRISAAPVTRKAPENQPALTPKPELKAEGKAPPPAGGHDWKLKLHATLLEMQMPFTADAVEHSEISESGGELSFVTPKELALSMKAADIQKAVQSVAGRAMKVKISFGDGASPKSALGDVKPQTSADEVSQRALSHPEVKRFQELFPDSHVRAVRNLKE